jgi:hypothetical protein
VGAEGDVGQVDAVPSTTTAVLLAANSLLLLSMRMPPRTVPGSMFPLVKVLLITTMPPAPIVPALMMLPLKVVWLISHSLVTPLNVPGALVKGIGFC